MERILFYEYPLQWRHTELPITLSDKNGMRDFPTHRVYIVGFHAYQKPIHIYLNLLIMKAGTIERTDVITTLHQNLGRSLEDNQYAYLYVGQQIRRELLNNAIRHIIMQQLYNRKLNK